MAARPSEWWPAFKTLLTEADLATERNLMFPFASLLYFGGEAMREEVAAAARGERKLANAFWEAMEDLRLSAEAYRLLGRRMTLEAFVRHEPRITYPPPDDWVWEDNWSGDALFYLVENDPDEARALGNELLAVSSDRGWTATIKAFIFEDLPEETGRG